MPQSSSAAGSSAFSTGAGKDALGESARFALNIILVPGVRSWEEGKSGFSAPPQTDGSSGDEGHLRRR